MTVELVLLVVTCSAAVINLILGAVRTYYQRKMWKGSKEYWDGWKMRSEDIRREASGD